MSNITRFVAVAVVAVSLFATTGIASAQVGSGPLTITTRTLPGGTVGTVYSKTLSILVAAQVHRYGPSQTAVCPQVSPSAQQVS